MPGHGGVIAQRGGACGLRLHIAPPSFLPTLRPPYFPQLAFVIAYPPPIQKPPCALIVTLGHIDGNDLPWQGQPQLPQHPRYGNYGITIEHGGYSFISFGVILLGFLCCFISSLLLSFNTLIRLWKIGVGISVFQVAVKRRFSIYKKRQAEVCT